jgi:hypothetical protein
VRIQKLVLLTVAGLLIPFAMAACWEFDNDYDQERCTESCGSDKICYRGSCVDENSLDAGTSDAPPMPIDALPIAVDAPPVTVDALPITVDAPPITVDAPPITVDAPLITVDAPPVTVDAPPITVDAPPVTVDAGPYCGDSVKNGSEECDGNDLGGATCVSIGYSGGTLSCSSCVFDNSLCLKVLDPNGKFLGGLGSQGVSVASDGTNYLVGWSHPSTGYVRVMGVAGAGQVLTGGAVAAVYAQSSAMTFDGTHFLSAWRNTSTATIQGRRVDTSGQILDAAPFEIGSSNYAWAYPLASAADGNQSFVVWLDEPSATQSSIYGARISTSGVVLDSPAILIGSYSHTLTAGTIGGPAVAAGNGRFWVTWWDSRTGGSIVYGVRISSNGTVEDTTPIPLSSCCAANATFSAFDGNNFATAWYRTTATDNVVITRVDQNGTVLDPNGITLTAPMVNAPGGAGKVKTWALPTGIVFDGTKFLVGFTAGSENGPDPMANWNLYTTAVTASGQADPNPTMVCDASGNSQPKVGMAISSSTVILAWPDYRSGSSELYMARIQP